MSSQTHSSAAAGPAASHASPSAACRRVAVTCCQASVGHRARGAWLRRLWRRAFRRKEHGGALIRWMRVSERLAASLHGRTHSASLLELVDDVGDCTSANKLWLAPLSLALQRVRDPLRYDGDLLGTGTK